jgi:two-component system sensor histidine kinase PfeS
MELALNNLDNPDKVTVKRFKHDLESLKQLAQDALTLAWLETEQPTLNEESLDLSDLIECIIESAEFEFPSHQIHRELPEEAPLRQTNHRALGQAIENVIRNALKYTPSAKKIEVLLREDRYQYFIEINDQGPGVPEKLLQEIFKPFFRVDKSRGEKAGGFGLGLSLAKRQIEAVGGTIAAHNIHHKTLDAPIGLSVHITLPVE